MSEQNNAAINVLLFPEKLDADYNFPNGNIRWTKEFTICTVKETKIFQSHTQKNFIEI
jgi:hypothetical protein